MKIALALTCAALTACAITPEQRARKAATMSSPVLCYVIYAGDESDRVAAGPILRERGFTCTEMAVQMGQQEFIALKQGQAAAASAAQTELGMRLLFPPAPPTPAKPIQCMTNNSGYTTCW